MHILFTSFFGVLIIKCLNIFVDPLFVFSNFTEITTDISDLVSNSIEFSWLKLLSLYFIVIYFLKRIIMEKSTN